MSKKTASASGEPMARVVTTELSNGTSSSGRLSKNGGKGMARSFDLSGHRPRVGGLTSIGQALRGKCLTRRRANCYNGCACNIGEAGNVSERGGVFECSGLAPGRLGGG